MRRRWCAVRKTTNHYRKRPISGFFFFNRHESQLTEERFFDFYAHVRRFQSLCLIVQQGTIAILNELHSDFGFGRQTSVGRSRRQWRKAKSRKINYRKQIFHRKLGESGRENRYFLHVKCLCEIENKIWIWSGEKIEFDGDSGLFRAHMSTGLNYELIGRNFIFQIAFSFPRYGGITCFC